MVSPDAYGQPFLQLDSLIDEVDESEAGTVLIGRITRGNSDLSDSLVVDLHWDDLTGLNLPQFVTIPSGEATVDIFATLQDNMRIDGDRSTTIQASTQGYASQEISLTILDDDVAGMFIFESDNSTSVREPAGTDTLSVSLSAEPESNVVLEVSNSLADQVSLNRNELLFTPSNWDQAQEVILIALDDNLVEPDLSGQLTIFVSAAESDDAFDGIAPQVVGFAAEDDETAAFSVSQSDGDSVVGEDGSSDTVSVVLDARPTADVLFHVSPIDGSEVSVQPSVLVFTSGNWNVPQDVILTGVDDQTVDGTINSIVGVSVNTSASQPEFRTLDAVGISVATTDNDVAAFRVTESGNSTAVSEAGGADTVAVVLDRQPLTDVVIAVTSAADQEVHVTPATLVFTPENWNQTQLVTASAVDDRRVDGSQSVSIEFDVDDAQSDFAFASLESQSVTVTTTDDDTAGFTLSKITATVSEDGTSVVDLFTVVLTSEPTSEVLLDLSLSANPDAAIDIASVTFTSANWNVAQTVNVTGVNDDIVDGDETTTITMAVNDAASDDVYDALADQTVTVTTTDDELTGSLDIDGDSTVNPSTDGILAFRYLFGVRGSALIAGAVASSMTHEEITAVLDSSTDTLDVDGSGDLNPSTDGILLFRYLFGVRGAALIAAAVDTENGTRTTEPEIVAWLDQFLLPVPAPASSTASTNAAGRSSNGSDASLSDAGAAVSGKLATAVESGGSFVAAATTTTQAPQLFDSPVASGNQAAAEASPTDLTPTLSSTYFRSWMNVVSSSAVHSGTSSAAGESAGQLDSRVLDNLTIEDLQSGEGIAAHLLDTSQSRIRLSRTTAVTMKRPSPAKN